MWDGFDSAAWVTEYRLQTTRHDTGAGGANVWDHTDVLQELSLKPNPFVKLPGGASMRVAARRSTRVGKRSGVPLEDLGVAPDERYS